MNYLEQATKMLAMMDKRGDEMAARHTNETTRMQDGLSGVTKRYNEMFEHTLRVAEVYALVSIAESLARIARREA